jgi:hypothetical protein
MRKDAPLAVDVPGPDRDSPGWVKVGVIAAVGFVIGIAWPRVVGVKLGPSAPGEAAAAAAASASAAASAKPRVPDAAPASIAAKAATTGTAAAIASVTGTPSASATAPGGPPQINVGRGSVIACKTTDGESKKGKECGSLSGLEHVVAPHLRKLAVCSAAEGQTGKLSFVATTTFPSGGLSWDVGRSSTVGNLEGINNCLKTQFAGVTANGIAHEHNRYTVAYTVTFAPAVADAASGKNDRTEKADKVDKSSRDDTAEKNAKDDKSDKPEAPVVAAGGEASVGWEVALVRDLPKTGSVIARLPRGTRVKIGPMKDGWYSIKYGDGFASDGFVHRGAIGR